MAIDVERLLQEIDPEAPSGENLEYDPEFMEMEREAAGRPEQSMGDETIPAQEPNWAEVKKKALELAARTKDLRIGVNLVKAVARSDGLPSLRDALKLLHGYVARYWDSVHPQLDPDDGNDPTMRVNVLVALQDPRAVLAAVRETPLVRSQLAGTFNFKHVLTARGELPAPAEGEPPSEAMIHGVFAECDLDELRATAEACAAARDEAAGIERALTEKVGAMHAADLSPLPTLLGQVHGFLAEQLSARGVHVEGLEGAAGGEAEGAQASVPGEIRNREDVVRTLDRITRYYETFEPSSPIPLLMARARRLVHANFLELIQDLAPDGVGQIENISGRKSSQEGSQE
jgi:type VI secretion system protein ImpA